MAEDGVGGGPSNEFALVLRSVGDSVVDVARVGAIEVCRDSFGLFGADGVVDGITDSMAPASCRLSSNVCGDDSLCLAGREVVYVSLL
jgi:hypothetical protein